jgi:hypothetical protein
MLRGGLFVVMDYSSPNEYKHKSTDSLYAHYSPIYEYDCDKFPNLALTTPQHFTLQSGESLYIPRGWWHWVKTTKRTFAVNYWFDNEFALDPFTFNHTVECNIELLHGKEVAIWNSGEGVSVEDQMYFCHFEDFYHSGLDNRYLITLENYPPGHSNSAVKETLSEHVHFPSHPEIETKNKFDFNVWISSNRHDTGLHYDDEDGVLTVVEGEKEIILFPPSDSQYLYPYEVSYEWRNVQAYDFRYNTGLKIRPIDGISCAELLYETCNGDKRVLSNISKLYERYKHNPCLVWGFKKRGEEYRWEFYNGTLSDSLRITSWDIYPNQAELSNQEHYYYKLGDQHQVGLPFWGYGKYREGDVLLEESKIFVIDSYGSFTGNYDEYMTELGYESIKERFRDLILNKYTCYDVCIHNKKPGEIFVQYLGLTNDEFVEFLTVNEYPSHIVDFVTTQVETGAYNINNEITIVYSTETQEVVRSGFYGNL